MTEILGLTNFSQVRGVLTVSERDLPDAVLESYDISSDLEADLSSWFEDYAAAPEAVTKLLKLYAKYRCAAWLAASGQNFIYTQMSDGTNQARRSDTEGFQALRLHLEGRARHYQERVEELIDVSSATRLTLFGVANPGRNPVLEGRD